MGTFLSRKNIDYELIILTERLATRKDLEWILSTSGQYLSSVNPQGLPVYETRGGNVDQPREKRVNLSAFAGPADVICVAWNQRSRYGDWKPEFRVDISARFLIPTVNPTRKHNFSYPDDHESQTVPMSRLTLAIIALTIICMAAWCLPVFSGRLVYAQFTFALVVTTVWLSLVIVRACPSRQRRAVSLRLLAVWFGISVGLGISELAALAWPTDHLADNPWYMSTGEALSPTVTCLGFGRPTFTGPDRHAAIWRWRPTVLIRTPASSLSRRTSRDSATREI